MERQMLTPYNWDFAKNMHNYLMLAEMCKGEFDFWNKISGTKVEEISNGPTTVYMCSTEGQTIGDAGNVPHLSVVVRSSDDVRDWVNNFRFRDKFNFGIHVGWERLHSFVWPQVLEFIKDQPADTNLTLGGHSLGGALAQLIAHDADLEGIHFTTVALFGSPSPFSKDYANGLAQEVWAQKTARFVYGNDIVPRVLNWKGNYHVGEEFKLGPNRRCKLAKQFRDHDLQNYIDALEAIVDGSDR
jgi:hypothetical protein